MVALQLETAAKAGESQCELATLITVLAAPREEEGVVPPLSWQAPQSIEAASLQGRSAVIAEDEGITQMQLRTILSRAGLRVLASARDGAEAVQVVLLHRPEIVLMDINMPGPFNGLEAARRILAEFHTCIVMVTAYDDFQQEAERSGTCGYVLKPINSNFLVPALEAAWQGFHQH